MPFASPARLVLAAFFLALAGCTASGSAGSGETGAEETAASAPASPALRLTPQASGTDALLISVSAVSERVAWVSGTAGTVLRTTDGGRTWQRRPVPGADSLQFRDVEAVSADVAYVLSIGEGAASRIYKTTDGGASWTLQFQNDDPQAFFDCMAFWDERTGFAFSDAVAQPDGSARFVVLATANGGAAWQPVPPDRLPTAFAGEGSFAASGTCAAAHGDRHGWIGTGNAADGPARVLRTADRGRTWEAAAVPVDAGDGAGIASVVFAARRGFALGGDVGQPARTDSAAARTSDGGRTWQRAASPAFAGPVYGAARVPGTDGPALVAVGPGGVSFSSDGARSWTAVDRATYWGVAFASPRAGWLAGPDGRLAHVALR